MPGTSLYLVADLGGTNVRLALSTRAGGVNMGSLRVWPHKQFATFDDALARYLSELHITRVEAAALAVAGPVTGDRVTLTNHEWVISRTEVAQTCACAKANVHFINDWQAIGWAVDDIKDEDLRTLLPAKPHREPGTMRVLTGPGSGLGTCLVHTDPHNGKLDVWPSEAAHMTFTPRTADQHFLNTFLEQRFKHVSWERVVSGPGLAMAYEAIAGKVLDPKEVTEKARAGDPVARRVAGVFWDSLAHYAGNLALVLLARGGVYLGGGILPQMADLLDVARFRQAFTDKGRFENYLTTIPVYLMVHPAPGILGAAHFLRSRLAPAA